MPATDMGLSSTKFNNISVYNLTTKHVINLWNLKKNNWVTGTQNFIPNTLTKLGIENQLEIHSEDTK